MFASFGQEIKIHEGTGRSIATVNCPNEDEHFNHINWSCNGKLLAITSNGTAILITMQGENDHSEIICHTIVNIPPVTIGCFCKITPNYILFGTERQQVFLYDLQEQAILQRLCDLPDAAQLIQLNALDTKLAVGCKNGQIFLYDNYEKISSSYFVHNSKTLSAIAFHPSSKHLLAGSSCEGNVSIWDIHEDTALFNYTSTRTIVALTFKNGPGNEIIFADDEKNVYMFDYYSSVCTATFAIVYAISCVYNIKDSTDLIISTKCGHIFKYNFNTDTVTTVFKKEDGYKIKYIAYPPNSTSPEPSTNENRIISGSGDNGVSTSGSTTASLQGKYGKQRSKWLKPSESDVKMRKFGAKEYHIVDNANIEALYNGISANTKDMLSNVVGEMNNEFLKMRMGISRIFCMMERRDRARWQEFNSSLLKLADNETEIDGEFIGNSADDVVNIH